ncbi:MAG: hypothetical protein GY768_14120 [Planctomycetaceae bacterium]|nr:hypothetical protein [Planctomycetaceae bacterium]
MMTRTSFALAAACFFLAEPCRLFVFFRQNKLKRLAWHHRCERLCATELRLAAEAGNSAASVAILNG